MKTRNVLLAVGLVLSAVVFASVFFPWLKFAMIVVDGYRLSELAKEQFGPNHWLVIATYLILLLPAISTLIFWQLVVLRKLRFPWWLLLLQAGIASGILGLLLSYRFDPSLDLQIELAAWMGWCGAVGLLVWQGIVRSPLCVSPQRGKNTNHK